MQYFSTLFGKELYMFRTDLLSIIRSLNIVFTTIGICHTSYVDCLLARSGCSILTSLCTIRLLPEMDKSIDSQVIIKLQFCLTYVSDNLKQIT